MGTRDGLSMLVHYITHKKEQSEYFKTNATNVLSAYNNIIVKDFLVNSKQ